MVTARRLAYIVRVIVRHIVAYAVTVRLGRWPRLVRTLRVRPLSGPIRFRVALEDCGGSFIKFGQMLALQPDILSFECCDVLFELLDRIEPFQYEEVERIFEAELGQPPHELFDTFAREPLATASVGQVHVATRDGRKYAVKVQRPGVEEQFLGDVRLMQSLAGVVRLFRIHSFYWLLGPIDEFVAWTQEELDYRREAEYTERLRRNAEGRLYERVPAVLWAYTTKRILVCEYLEGTTVLAFLRARDSGDEVTMQRLRHSGCNLHVVCRNIIDNFLGAVFRHGMFHADLHPANLLILPGNAVGYVDFGITGAISGYSRRNLIALTLAYTRGDFDGMADAFFGVCAMADDADPVAFRRALRACGDGWYRREGPTRELRKNFTLVMLDMLKVSRNARIWPDRDVVKYIRSAIAIDGLITRMAPSFNVGQHLEEICAAHLRWQLPLALFSETTMLDWMTAGARLMADGTTRLRTALAAATPNVRVPAADRRRASVRWQVAALVAAAGVCVVSLSGVPVPSASSATPATLVSTMLVGGVVAFTMRRLRRAGE
jgi:ubiquinone biosynthesis protein